MDVKEMPVNSNNSNKKIFFLLFSVLFIMQLITLIMLIILIISGIPINPEVKPPGYTVVDAPQKIPVFMYHTSSEDDPDVGDYAYLYVKPSEFEKQIKYLTENKYTFCIFDDWYDLKDIENPVFITFDDGYKENYTEIFPILKKYNAKITIFLVADLDGKDITWEMVREMSDSGLVKFESHTVNHAKLDEISSDGELLTRELRDSRTKIEQMTGRDVHAIAYPYGAYDDIVKEKAREFYQFGLRSYGGMHQTDIDNYEIRRFVAERNMTLDDFISMLNG